MVISSIRFFGIVVLLLLCCLPRPTNAQAVVVIGPNGKVSPPPSDTQGCIRVEQISPNLTLNTTTHIRGFVRDQTGAPFAASPVEVRLYLSEVKQSVVGKVTTDSQGSFELGNVAAGKYRLLLSPSRAFAQPSKLECASRDCTLDVTLVVNPSDLITAACPVR